MGPTHYFRRYCIVKRNTKGIIHGAFYRRNTCEDTKGMLWGRSQNSLMEVFKYGMDEKTGKISITKRS